MRNYIITFAKQIKKTNFAKYSVSVKKEDEKTRRQEDEKTRRREDKKTRR